MNKHYAKTAAAGLVGALLIACSGGETGSSDATNSALSQGQGPCGAPVLQVIVRDKEHRFGFGNQQVALNPQIPIQNICQNGVKASCMAKCAQAEAAAVASNVKGFSGNNVPAQLRAMGQLADTFNAALGNTSDFADHPIDQDPGANPNTDPNASTTTSSGTAGQGGGGAVSCNATVLEVIVQGPEHRFGFDGQQVALNPLIPIQNICQNRVSSSCTATCAQAEKDAAAEGVKGFSGADDPAQLRRMGDLADAFNRALGNATDFADHPILR
jgi:hypothetical protein